MINYLYQILLILLLPKKYNSFRENVTKEESMNIIDRQKENYKQKISDNNNITFILKNEFEKMISFSEGIPFYISFLDYTRKNYLKITNNRTSYLTNYKGFIGKSDKYFMNAFSMMYPMKEEIGENRRSVLSIMDDVLLKKVYSNESCFYLMRNQFLCGYDDIIKSKNFLKYYDLNIIYNIPENEIEKFENYFSNYSNILILKEKFSKEGEVMEKYLRPNNYSNVFSHKSYKIKMEKIGKVKNQFDIILNNSNLSDVNLLNFLINPQIKVIKKHIKEIEIEALPLLYYYKSFNEEEFNIQIEELKKTILILYDYLNKYSFQKSDFGIDCYYFCILILFICIASLHIIQTLREFDFAIQRKVK